MGGARSWARRGHPNRATPRNRQRLGPRCHVPASVPPREAQDSPSCRCPGWATPPTVRRGAVRAVGSVVSGPAAPEPKPTPARRGLRHSRPTGERASGLPGGRPRRRPPAPTPGAASHGAHRQRVKSACSPPLGRRLRSAGLARPAQPFSSAPFRSPELHSAYPRTGLLPDTSGAPRVSEAIL